MLFIYVLIRREVGPRLHQTLLYRLHGQTDYVLTYISPYLPHFGGGASPSFNLLCYPRFSKFSCINFIGFVLLLFSSLCSCLSCSVSLLPPSCPVLLLLVFSCHLDMLFCWRKRQARDTHTHTQTHKHTKTNTQTLTQTHTHTTHTHTHKQQTHPYIYI